MIVQKSWLLFTIMRSLYLKIRFPSDLRSINALNYLQVPSIDWSDSGYVQHFINVIEKMLTR